MSDIRIVVLIAVILVMLIVRLYFISREIQHIREKVDELYILGGDK